MLLTGNVVRKSLKSRRLFGYLWRLSSHCINSSVLQFMLHVVASYLTERRDGVHLMSVSNYVHQAAM